MKKRPAAAVPPADDNENADAGLVVGVVSYPTLFQRSLAAGDAPPVEELKLTNPSWHVKNHNWCIKKSGGKQLMTVASPFFSVGMCRFLFCWFLCHRLRHCLDL